MFVLASIGVGAGLHTPSRVKQSLMSTRRRMVFGRWSRVGGDIVFLKARLLVLARCWSAGRLVGTGRCVNGCQGLGSRGLGYNGLG